MLETVASPERQLSDNDIEAVDQLRGVYHRLRQELGCVIVGHRDVIERLSICLFARGHALLMGVPGLAKTLLVSKVAETMSLRFSRIQFTPDLMPMDITGTDILQEGAGGSAISSLFVGRCSPTSSWPTRSTARRPRPRRRCSKPCRNTRSPRWGRRCRWNCRSWCWPRRTRSSRKGPTRCPKRNWTASCS